MAPLLKVIPLGASSDIQLGSGWYLARVDRWIAFRSAEQAAYHDCFCQHGFWESWLVRDAEMCGVLCCSSLHRCVICTFVTEMAPRKRCSRHSTARLKRTSERTGAPQSNVSCKTCRFWWRWDLVHFSLWHQWRIVLTVAEFRFNGNVTVEILGSHRRTLPSELCPILHPGTCPPLFPRAWKGVEGIW